MSEPALRKRRESPYLVILQAAVLIIAATVPFLVDHGYGAFAPEVLSFTSLLILAALPLLLLATRVVAVRRVLFAVLACWLLDLYFIRSDLLALATLASLIGLSFTRAEGSLRSVATVFAICFLAFAILSPAKPAFEPSLGMSAPKADRSSTDLPVVLHLILDEQGTPITARGISGPGEPEQWADRMMHEYTERGFAAHTWVRAIAGSTEQSLGKVFADAKLVTEDEFSNWEPVDGSFSFRLKHNAEVDRLLDRRFKVTVVQSSYLELCLDRRAECHTYPRDIHGGSMSRFDGALSDRVWLIAMLFHTEQSTHDSLWNVSLYRPLADPIARLAGLPYKRQFWTRPATVLHVLDELEQRVPSMQSGEAYLVHLLGPHFPYVLDAQCQLKPRSTWLAPAWVAQETRVEFGDVEKAYAQQSECIHRRVLALLDAMDRHIGQANSIIVVHGDHGSRLQRKLSRPTLAQRNSGRPDGSLDTVLFFRAPETTPAINEERSELATLVRTTLERSLSRAGLQASH